MTTKRLNLFLLGCVIVCLATLACVAARGAELPAPHFTPIPKFLPVPHFLPFPKFDAKPEAVDDLGIRDSIRIMRACRAATAGIPLPQTRAEVGPYVDLCTPIVTDIIKREMRDTFPLSAATTTIKVPVAAKIVDKAKEVPKKLTKKVRQVIGYEKRCGPNGCTMEPVYGEVEVPLTPDEIKANELVDKFAAATLTEKEVLDAKAAGLKDAVREVIGQRYSYATCGMICFSHGSQLYLLFKDGHEELAPVEQQPASDGAGWGGEQKVYILRFWKNW
jgi:hypothetical protein